MSVEMKLINTNNLLKRFTLNLDKMIKNINYLSNRQMNESSDRRKGLVIVFKQRNRMINCGRRNMRIMRDEWCSFNESFTTIRANVSTLTVDDSQVVFKKQSMMNPFVFITVDLLRERMTARTKSTPRDKRKRIKMMMILNEVVDRLNILFFQMKRIHDNIFNRQRPPFMNDF